MKNPDPSDPLLSAAVHSENTRIGLVLFIVYVQEYFGFVLMCAFAKDTMSQPSVGGMNFAVVCGFALIIQAFVLALIYMIFCKPEAAPIDDLTEGALAEELEKEEGSA
jgi:uncharacterized membrane protein (DUF485 family)